MYGIPVCFSRRVAWVEGALDMRSSSHDVMAMLRRSPRATDIDAWFRAVHAFERAGWHQDIDQSHRAHGRNDQRTYGSRRWYRPACAKRRP